MLYLYCMQFLIFDGKVDIKLIKYMAWIISDITFLLLFVNLYGLLLTSCLTALPESPNFLQAFLLDIKASVWVQLAEIRLGMGGDCWGKPGFWKR